MPLVAMQHSVPSFEKNEALTTPQQQKKTKQKMNVVGKLTRINPHKTRSKSKAILLNAGPNNVEVDIPPKSETKSKSCRKKNHILSISYEPMSCRFDMCQRNEGIILLLNGAIARDYLVQVNPNDIISLVSDHQKENMEEWEEEKADFTSQSEYERKLMEHFNLVEGIVHYRLDSDSPNSPYIVKKRDPTDFEHCLTTESAGLDKTKKPSPLKKRRTIISDHESSDFEHCLTTDSTEPVNIEKSTLLKKRRTIISDHESSDSDYCISTDGLFKIKKSYIARRKRNIMLKRQKERKSFDGFVSTALSQEECEKIPHEPNKAMDCEVSEESIYLSAMEQLIGNIATSECSATEENARVSLSKEELVSLHGCCTKEIELCEPTYTRHSFDLLDSDDSDTETDEPACLNKIQKNGNISIIQF